MNHRCRLTPTALSTFALTATLLVPQIAAAQGMVGGVSGSPTVNPQAGGVDDVWALDSNPAGIAYVDTFQLVGGYIGTFGDPAGPVHRALVLSAFSPIDGLTFGGGTTYTMPFGGGSPFIHGRMAVALRFDRSLSVGMQLNTLTPIGSLNPRFLGDLGVQLRPFRWFGIGATLESLGTVNPDDRSKARIGLSLRPLGRWITVGADARVIAGSSNLITPAALTGIQLEPSLTARLQVYGLVLYAGGSVTNLGVGALNGTLPGYRMGIGVEVNTAHLGATLLGGASGDTSRFPTFETGALMRISAEEFDSVVPRFSEWLTFTLSGKGVPVEESGNIISELFSSPMHPVTVMAGLKRAANDPAVEGVVLRFRGLGVGWGKAAELRRSIERLRQNGKHVVVHLIGGDDAAIYVAAAAERVYMAPSGGIALDGIHAQLTYLANALERFGIKAEAVTAGDYKSAPRTFTHDGPSPQELEVQNALLDTLFNLLVEGISEGRSMTEDRVKEIIDFGGLNADEAKEHGIVDDLCYWGEIRKHIENDIEGAGRPWLRDDYLDDGARNYAWDEPGRVAVIPIVGEISMGRSGGGLFGIFGGGGGAGSDDVIDAIHAARDDDDIKAVVLRIDSPGGDAVASDLIFHEVMALREEKPVIASMGDVAASGGYYIAAGAKEIFAQPGTITGSIGVFSMFFQGGQLARDLGVNNIEVGRGALPGPNLLRGPTDAERTRMKEQVEWVYERFLSAIKEGRGMDDAKLREVAGGRVWSGQQAFGHGLVDELGGLDEAIAKAAALGGLSESEYELSILTGSDEALPRIQTAVRTLAGTKADEADIQKAIKLLLGDGAAMSALAAEGRPMAAMPVQIELR